MLNGMGRNPDYISDNTPNRVLPVLNGIGRKTFQNLKLDIGLKAPCMGLFCLVMKKNFKDSIIKAKYRKD